MPSPLWPSRHDHSMDEYAGRVHALRLQLTHFDQLLDLGDGDPGVGGHDRVGIARAPAINQVPHPVPAPRGDERIVADERPLEQELSSFELAYLLALGHDR